MACVPEITSEKEEQKKKKSKKIVIINKEKKREWGFISIFYAEGVVAPIFLQPPKGKI